jgi:hypothetical protein
LASGFKCICRNRSTQRITGCVKNLTE